MSDALGKKWALRTNGIDNVISAFDDMGRNAKNVTTQVGWFKKDTDQGRPTATIAQAQEYDVVGHIPARPFVRPAIAKHEAEWIKAIEANYDITKGNGEATMSNVGQVIAGDIRKEISSRTRPVLATSTVKAKMRKGSTYPDKPLIDTGTMYDQLKHVETVK